MLGRRALLAGGAGLLARAARAQPAEDVAVAVSSTSFVLAGVLLGQKAGLFARDGIALRIVVMDSGNAAMAAMLGGSVPFSVSGPSEALAARARGQDVVIVANLYAGLAGNLVLSTAAADKSGVPRDAPVRDRLHALDGLIIAMPSATSALLAPIREAAAGAGAKPRFTYMAQGAMSAALENGAIQGFDASFPFAGIPIVRGTGVTWIDGPGGELPPAVLPASSSCIQASAATVRSNPALIRRMQQAIEDIARFIATDQPAARTALAAAYPQLGPAEIDLAFNQQWRNWTKSQLTEDDIRQELKLLAASVKLPGLDRIDPKAALSGRL